MKKLIRDTNKLRYCAMIVVACIIAIISIIYFAQSYSYWADEWGTDISFDMDSIVMLLCAVSIGVYGGYGLYALEKNKSTETAYYLCFSVVAVLISFYPLGCFFKGLAKGKGYVEIQDYLYIGLLGLCMICYLALSYWNKQKNKD